MMRYFIFLLFFLQGCCWFGCDDQPNNLDKWNKDGIQVSKKFLWKVPLDYTYTVDPKNNGHGSVYAGENLWYQNGYFVGSNPEPGKSFYQFRDIETGKLLWQIPNDVVNSRGYSMGIFLNRHSGTAQYKQYVITDPHYPLCFNLKTGKIQWRLESEKGDNEWDSYITQIENKLYFYKEKEYEDEEDRSIIYELDMVTGVYKTIFDFPFAADTPHPFKNKKNELLFLVKRYNFSEKKVYLDLYNYTQKKWLYKDVKTDGGLIKLYREKDRVFFTNGHGFACHQLSTGKEIWSDSSYNYHDNSGPRKGIMVGNKLIVGMGDDFLMCINMDSDYKDVVWENHRYNIGNTTSPFHLLNGVVYFAAEAAICAIEPDTGKFLWFLESPDYKEYGSGAFFKPEIWVILGKNGKKGRIIGSTYRSGVCYEAIK